MTWITWIIFAGVLIIVELFLGSFYLLMIGLGCVASALTAWLGGAEVLQFLVGASVASIATLTLRQIKGRHLGLSADRDPNVNLDIGQVLNVPAWDAHRRARVMYRGSLWDIELAGGYAMQAGDFMIQRIEGSRLIVAPV